MKKTLVIILCIALTVCLLSSCSQKQTISATDFDFNVLGAKTQTSVASTPAVSAGDGNTLLVITFSVPSTTDPTLVTDTFINGETRSTANGNECVAVTMMDEGTDTTYYAVYEVPSASDKTNYTISGNSFASFEVTA